MAESPMAELMLEAAQRDATVFFKLVADADVHDSMLGFHAQQAVETALKAVLFKRGVLVPRTHHIDALLDTLRDASHALPPHADVLDELNPYAVQARYGTLDAGPLERTIATAWLTDVLAWAKAACAS